jgi:two-component system, OmpR family, sensor kinase
MLDSVRVRLTVWYTAVMACVLVVLAAAAYFVLRENSERRMDASIVEMAESFLSTVNAELNGVMGAGGLKEGVAAAILEHRFSGTVFVVLDERGEIVGASERLPQGEPENVTVESLRSVASGVLAEAHPFHTIRVRGITYRGYARHFSAGKSVGTLVVLQSLHSQEEFLETAAQTFALVIPLAVLLAGAGGYFLARRSLAPVVTMSAQAGRIGAENLDKRLAVKNSRDELGQLAQSFNDLLDRLDQSFERQRRFVADASHELRTPVAILFGEADVTLAQSNRTPEEYRESLSILRGEARRLKHIVEDLFTLARADAGQHPLMLADFYLDELIAECARSVRTLAGAKQIALHCETPREILIHADEALLRRMIMNLLDNAIKYTPSRGAVTICVGEKDSEYNVSISDTGPGIPSELQPRIFERFFRADKVRSRTESDGGGAGLGLSISQWIAEAHGGRIELTQSDENGSTFTVFFPATAMRPLIPRLSSSR